MNHDAFHDYYGTPCCQELLHVFPADRLYFGVLFGVLGGFPAGLVVALWMMT